LSSRFFISILVVLIVALATLATLGYRAIHKPVGPPGTDLQAPALDQSAAAGVDHCSPNPCLNSGACTDKVVTFTCSCVPPWTGRRCGNATFNVTASARGSYASSTWYPPAPGITISGNCCGGNEMRAYFVFRIPTFTGTVRFVMLHLDQVKYESPDESEALAVYDVSTPVTTLTAHPRPWDSIFADLGGGTQLGMFNVTASGTGTTIPILLPRAVGAVSEARGTTFAIGVTLATPSGQGNENVSFSSGSEGRTHRLEIRVTDP
jgi:EGF-like domain